jgi:hypothetical protein
MIILINLMVLFLVFLYTKLPWKSTFKPPRPSFARGHWISAAVELPRANHGQRLKRAFSALIRI